MDWPVPLGGQLHPLLGNSGRSLSQTDCDICDVPFGSQAYVLSLRQSSKCKFEQLEISRVVIYQVIPSQVEWKYKYLA